MSKRSKTPSVLTAKENTIHFYAPYICVFYCGTWPSQRIRVFLHMEKYKKKIIIILLLRNFTLNHSVRVAHEIKTTEREYFLRREHLVQINFCFFFLSFHILYHADDLVFYLHAIIRMTSSTENTREREANNKNYYFCVHLLGKK